MTKKHPMCGYFLGAPVSVRARSGTQNPRFSTQSSVIIYQKICLKEKEMCKKIFFWRASGSLIFISDACLPS